MIQAIKKLFTPTHPMLKNLPKFDPGDSQFLREQRVKHTPDLKDLEEYNHQWLFIYCDFMTSLRRGAELTPDMAHCSARIAYTKDQYVLWKRNAGKDSFPVAMKEKCNFAPSANIQGELYLVNPSAIIRLDNAKGNKVQFNRRQVRIVVPYYEINWVDDRDTTCRIIGTVPQNGNVRLPRSIELNAWMYIGADKYWNDKLDGGYNCGPVRVFKPNNERNKPYYRFTIKELNE